MRAGRRQRRRRERGYTFVWVLAALVIMGIGLAAIGPRWADDAQRERESDLMRFGVLYARAIQQYRDGSPGTQKQWPRELGDLLLDTRYAGTVRYLRRLYPDPINPAQPWGLVRTADGAIVGVHSNSTERPIRREPIQVGHIVLPRAERYEQWRFVAGNEP